MKNRFAGRILVLSCSAVALFLNSSAFPYPEGNDQATRATLAVPSTYVVDLVANASYGADMNDAGDVVGTSYPDPGCGSTCLPPLETVVWKGGLRIVLPAVPFSSSIFPIDINALGWIAGFAGIPGTTTHAVVWKPVGSTYQAIDLGTLPGSTTSTAIGIDDLGRVVGWSGAPFMWTEAGGMVNLSSLGFPNESPLGISPGGTVATTLFWYHLGDPGSVVSMLPPPAGWGPGGGPVAINDDGDQARFLGTGTQGLIYPFRYQQEGGGAWQQISFTPTGHLSSAGVGSINDAGDITLTVASAGMIAYGPDGLAQSLSALVSPAYGGSVLTSSGPMNASGQILARMIIGQSGQRLVRLVPGEPCISNCIRVVGIQMKGKGPGFCDQGQAQVKARVTVTNESGTRLSGVTVTGHFFDDYWLDETVVGTTNSQGQVVFAHVGPPCIGAIALLVTDATVPSRTLDRTTGLLTNYVLPLPTEEPLSFDEVSATEGIHPAVVSVNNYPNPFNPSTTIEYTLNHNAWVTLRIYNLLGEEVATLVDGPVEAGVREVRFDASNLPSGMYFYRLQTGNVVETKKLILMK